MNKNKFILGFISGIVILSLVGCSGLLGKNQGSYGKTAKKEAAAGNKIDQPTQQLNKIQDQRLTSIGSWSSGIEYSLNKSTTQEPAIDVAKQINERVQALANKPELREQEEIFKLIDSLLTNSVEGQRLLEAKDKIIIKQQTQIVDLQNERNDAIENYRDLAQSTALKNDATTETLKDMDSFWGGGAILYGVKKLISRLAITLGILAVLFIALRILATTNPIAASIFAIFDQVGSWIINILKRIFPKATSISGLVPTEDYQGYKNTLNKVIDAIESVKLKESTLKETDPNAFITTQDLSDEISKVFNSDDADRVSQAKKTLLWKL